MQNAKWNGGAFKHLTREGATELLDKACKEVEANAKKIIAEVVYAHPQIGNYKRTGHLMSSIHSLIDWSTMTGMVGTKVHYATYVEFGTYASRVPPFDSHTKGMKPRPYLRPALNEWKQKQRML
jgi:phage gpG-like protein